jgi:hypothetical protein
MMPPTGLPSAFECSLMKTASFAANFNAAAANTDVAGAAINQPVPQNKHWVVISASISFTQPNPLPHSAANTIAGIYVVNQSANPPAPGILFSGNGFVTPQDACAAFLGGGAFVQVGNQAEATTSNVQQWATVVPWFIVPPGCLVYGIISPPNAGAGTVWLNIVYFQRDNPICP